MIYNKYQQTILDLLASGNLTIAQIKRKLQQHGCFCLQDCTPYLNELTTLQAAGLIQRDYSTDLLAWQYKLIQDTD